MCLVLWSVGLCIKNWSYSTRTHTLAVWDETLSKYFIDLRWQGVTEYAFQTKYATTNANTDTGSTSSHCAFKLINQILFFSQRLPSWLTMPSTRGCAMACLCCSVLVSSWLDSSSTLSGKQIIPKRNEKHILTRIYSVSVNITCVITVLWVKRCLCVCCRVVYSVLFDSWEIIGPYRAWWLLNGLLLVLQALHIIWFYLIARIAIKAIFKGKVSPVSPSWGIGHIYCQSWQVSSWCIYVLNIRKF